MEKKKKQGRKELACMLVWVKQQSQLWRWRGSVKEQRGSGFVSPRREKSDGISLPFAPPTRLRIWRHKSARGCRDSSPLLSLRVLFWQGRRKGGWLAYFTFPPVFHLIWERPGKDSRYLHKLKTVCTSLPLELGPRTKRDSQSSVMKSNHEIRCGFLTAPPPVSLCVGVGFFVTHRIKANMKFKY